MVIKLNCSLFIYYILFVSFDFLNLEPGCKTLHKEAYGLFPIIHGHDS